MKIVQFIQRYPPAVGGSETWCREVSRALVQQGHEVRVLTMNVDHEEEFWKKRSTHDDKPPFASVDVDEGVYVRRYKRTLPVFVLHHLLFKRILDWKFGVLFYGPHSVEMYLKMWNELIAADVIMLHTLPFPHNYIGFWAGRVLRKPVVIIPHFHPGHPDYERRSNYWLMNKCDAVLADTAFERNHLATRGVGQEKIAVVGVGVNPDDYRPGDIQKLRATMEQIWGVRVGDKVITFLGRKMEKKGVSVLIDAIKVLHEHIPVKLILAGPGFEWFSVLYMSLASEVKSFVIDAGVLTHEEKVDLLHATDILVLPSKFESFGIVFLEAWACGVPVIGTTEGAAPEVIGDAGLTVPYGDVAALSSCIRHALADPSKLRRMAEQGRRKIHEYHSWQMIGARVEKVLEGVIA